MASKYDKPITITVTASDWRAARAEELRQERLENTAARLGYDGPQFLQEIAPKQKEYSCICVVAQAIAREVPGTTLSTVKNAVSVGGSDCTLRFRNGTKREYELDDEGQNIVDAFDTKVPRPRNRTARAPMPRRLLDGVEVTLTPKTVSAW